MKKPISILTAVLFILLTFTQCKKEFVKSDRCNLVPEAGNCYAMFSRYYFDTEANECKEFIWGGCDGVVPFDTMEECENECGCN